MRRAYLDFTGDFAQTIGLDWLPRSWRVIGSLPSPAPRVCRLVLANYDLDDGPDAVMTVVMVETHFKRHLTIVLTSEDGTPIECEPAPTRYFITSDDSGHQYAIPVAQLIQWNEWVKDPDAIDPPAWAIRIDGHFTFTDPQC